jgi:hypothetical protein
MEAGLSEAGLKSEQKWSKGTDQEIGHQASLIFHLYKMKDKKHEKKGPYGR